MECKPIWFLLYQDIFLKKKKKKFSFLIWVLLGQFDTGDYKYDVYLAISCISLE